VVWRNSAVGNFFYIILFILYYFILFYIMSAMRRNEQGFGGYFVDVNAIVAIVGKVMTL